MNVNWTETFAASTLYAPTIRDLIDVAASQASRAQAVTGRIVLVRDDVKM